MKNIISLSFKKQSDSEFGTTINRIVTQMDGNSNFPNQPEAMGVVKKTLPEFILALIDASGRPILGKVIQ